MAVDRPFEDQPTVTRLYQTPSRLTTRVGSLLGAKVAGRDPAVLLSEAIERFGLPRSPGRLIDIGCGRGTAAKIFRSSPLIDDVVVLDRSSALAALARDRAGASACVGDFGALPVGAGVVDAAAALFCLYHALDPHRVVGEVTATVRAGGLFLVATKSRSSYSELDDLMVRAELDPLAGDRPSLYERFHSDNCAGILAPWCDVLRVEHNKHVFHFEDPRLLATYVSTSPKYPNAGTDFERIAAALARSWPRRGFEMTSIVTTGVGRVAP